MTEAEVERSLARIRGFALGLVAAGALVAVALGAWRGLVYLTLTGGVTIMHLFLLDRLLRRFAEMGTAQPGRRDLTKVFLICVSFVLVGALVASARPGDVWWFLAGATVIVGALVAEAVVLTVTGERR